ncbi:MAG: hypothetical protein Q7U47_14085 [Paludibacter sp.]|nr:hypothetical protein [Paludibacter sp.]
MKTIIKIFLGISIVVLGYMCIQSIMTPIKFDKEKEFREKAVIQRLVDIRKAQLEFKDQKGGFTTSIDTLIGFLKTAKKKAVLKEGSLSDKQLEAGLTEAKAAKIVKSKNMKEIIANGLENFRRDTAYISVLDALFPDQYTQETIDKLAIIPYSNNEKFELKVNNSYLNTSQILIPLFDASAHYKTYLHDLNHQELLNTIDLRVKLEKFPGLKVGSVDEPNNFSGNWE